jgi:hypothetical protein
MNLKHYSRSCAEWVQENCRRTAETIESNALQILQALSAQLRWNHSPKAVFKQYLHQAVINARLRLENKNE